MHIASNTNYFRRANMVYDLLYVLAVDLCSKFHQTCSRLKYISDLDGAQFYFVKD
jgi:hypothetical protein